MEQIRVFAPATVANVASGFDVLGFALEQPGDVVTLTRTRLPGVRVTAIHGDQGRLPFDSGKNTAAVAAGALLAAIGDPFGLELVVEKRMPLASGLGSSAASAVAAVTGANLLAGSPLGKEQLLPFTLLSEKAACGSAHADNVAPALLGGFVLVRSTEPLDIIQLPVPPGLACAVVHPHTEVRTEDARRILRKEIQLAVAIRQWGNLAALVAALYRGDLELLGRSLQDVVAEPVRSVLIPGFDAVKAAALAAGALGCSISGSGPSVFALCADLAACASAGAAMTAAFRQAGLASDLYISKVNTAGPKLLEIPGNGGAA
ncbi:MAG TPA: homoserine kinase [bacterium]|nr:homoserine kinase [bacterium]HQI47930.1 homoserine kinase [bacterium]HQJ64415.1 homoserine kinase [bacterium]HQJ65527.1 homoserine kinase [bacterium]